MERLCKTMRALLAPALTFAAHSAFTATQFPSQHLNGSSSAYAIYR